MMLQFPASSLSRGEEIDRRMQTSFLTLSAVTPSPRPLSVFRLELRFSSSSRRSWITSAALPAAAHAFAAIMKHNTGGRSPVVEVRAA